MKLPAVINILMLLPLVAFSQVGINTTNPDPSSILDLNASDKGLLVPRIALSGTTDNSTIVNPVESLLVYNTASTGGVTPGFYYWTGTEWTTLSTNGGGSGSGSEDPKKWDTEGNELTGSEFIGSTNYNDLQFRVNNNQVANFDPNGGLTIGLGASANDNNAIAIGTGANASTNNEATAIGPSASATAFRSTALGYQANATSNNATLALGYNATASGFQSTAIGYNAQATTNNNSLAIGSGSTATGLNSTALGATASSSGQNAMAIGYGATATNANTIVLGNNIYDVSDWNATKVGIGVSNPSEKLEVRGNIKVTSGTLKLESGTIKIADGTQGEGKVLTSDAQGNATWTDASSIGGAPVMAETSASSSANLSQWSPINFGNVSIAEGVNVNSNHIQILTSGTYRITYAVSVHKSGGGDGNVKFFLTNGWGSSNKINGTTSYIFMGNGDRVTATATKYVQLDASDQIYVFTDTSSSNISTLTDGTYLNVELIRAD
ncbi:MAG: hypothetical protein CL596_00470 [Alteromonas sp.]|nr:hypothetical protein [Alteromonas sp.]MAY22052.1 hypothetical protein [Flavobacteriaceae bacterium]|tara:strand:- start:8405 stop:9889 length:1485 start_codon:yes stop_codon:yes gene_type:complete